MGEWTQVWLGYFQFHLGLKGKKEKTKKRIPTYSPLREEMNHVPFSRAIIPTHNLSHVSLPSLTFPSASPKTMTYSAGHCRHVTALCKKERNERITLSRQVSTATTTWTWTTQIPCHMPPPQLSIGKEKRGHSRVLRRKANEDEQPGSTIPAAGKVRYRS